MTSTYLASTMMTSTRRSSSPFEFVRGGKLDNPYFSSSSHSNPHIMAEMQYTSSINDSIVEALSTWADANLVVPDDADIVWSRTNDAPEPPRGRSNERSWRRFVQRAKNAVKRSAH
ncbi:hypothetical protein RhiXN_01961 [Rhizoctonia solani]|uniref:Uncharacterized protein n=1 Tax=Rhizoctonia solani TaxID=456999 RepID=A0A8H8PBZ9_9AGAM|nr:uncharacterized protein RhiXN_01961 [Rhizoctonia solani]QRW27366.1 hypothetical protein RhiXN_01961 [Rhizoctonia solani]